MDLRDEDTDAPTNTSDTREQFHRSIGRPSALVDSGTSRAPLAPFRRRLIFTDVLVVCLAIGTGLLVSSRASTWAIDPTLAIYGTPVLIALVWIGFLILRGSYDQRLIGLGAEELRRVVSATILTFALVAGVSYLIRADISRAYAFISLPLGLLGLVSARLVWRSWLHRRRGSDDYLHPTLVIGDGSGADELADRLERDSFAGYRVAGRFSPPPEEPNLRDEWIEDLAREIDDLGVHAVAVAPTDAMTSQVIRMLAWQLEGRSVDLLLAPAVVDIANARLTMRPVAGLPLVHLGQASLSRPQRFTKRVLDLSLGIPAIVLTSPVMLVAAIGVKLTSRGPVIFRQVRVGRGGSKFTMLKFRSMANDADKSKDGLRSSHSLNDPMFKLKSDPRVTSVGRIIRRWSIDELPQLFNVVGGSMSLVGPRPHPLDDVNRYELQAYRRLALKPGITGLWQVEGRSDLDWATALQLDLYYVETWSIVTDVLILLRTFRAVLQGRGAH